jgi:glycosyltransferase involved in cell wall biosynthesis
MLLSDALEISVVIPAYNAASTIESALKSIQRQTISNLKIIVVNDGSTDMTREIVQRLAISDARIHLVSQVNGGIVDALNAGLRLCETEYIARHDADDLAVSDRFEKQLLYLESHPDCVAVSGAVRHIYENNYVLRERVSLHSPDLADPTCCPQIEPYLIHPFLMMRRSALDKVGGYRYVFHAEDTYLYWRLQDVGRLYSLPDILGDYRIHSEVFRERASSMGVSLR